MDIFKVTTWFPESFIENPLFNKALTYIGIAVISLSLIALVGLASYRYNSLSLSEAELGNLVSSNQGEFELALLSAEKSNLIRFVFIIIAIFTLLTSIVGFILLPTVKMVLACVALVIFLIPVVVFFAFGKMFEILITLLYNIVLSLFEIITGLTNGVNQKLRKLFRVDDSIDDNEQVAEVSGRVPTNFLAENRGGSNTTNERNREQNELGQNPNSTQAENLGDNIQNMNPERERNDLPQEINHNFDENGFNPLIEEEGLNV